MNTYTPAFELVRVLNGYARQRFLPALFGDDFMCAENNVYLYADRFLAGYDGVVWDFALLPSGGGFMKPAAEKTWRFVNPANHSDVSLSSEAAGIVITSLVLNHRSWMYDRHDDVELCILYCRRQRQLTNYAFYHSEAAVIFAAQD